MMTIAEGTSAMATLDGFTRRDFLRRGAMVALSGAMMPMGSCGSFASTTSPSTTLASQPARFSTQRYKVAACDWMMLKRQKLGAIKLAKDCGLDGVVVDLGPLGTRPDIENQLRKDDVRQQFTDQSKELGVEISTLALSCFYGQSWSDHPKADDFTAELVDLMSKMNVTTGYLPLRPKKNDPDAHKKLVDHLKRLAPRAEAAKVSIGVEAPFDIDGYKRLLDDVGSTSIQMTYHLGNLVEMGGIDVYQGIRQLGRDRICTVFATSPDGKHLEDGPIDCHRVKESLDEIGWGGWLILERSRAGENVNKHVKENFSANASYLKSVFQV